MIQDLNKIYSNKKGLYDIVRRDEYTVILSNCSLVMYGELEYLFNKYPSLDITMESSASGSENFLVIFTLYPHQNFLFSAIFAQYMFSLFFCVLSIIHYCLDYGEVFGNAIKNDEL